MQNKMVKAREIEEDLTAKLKSLEYEYNQTDDELNEMKLKFQSSESKRLKLEKEFHNMQLVEQMLETQRSEND